MNDKINSLLKYFGWLIVGLNFLLCFLVNCFINSKFAFDCLLFLKLSPTSITLGIFCFILYERILWKFNPFEKTPKLSEKYDCAISSTFNDLQRITGEIIIEQTLLTCYIKQVTCESESYSVTSSIKKISGEYKLIYTYMNTPNSQVRPNSPMHFGTAILTINSDETLKGQYYTDRLTTGDMFLTIKNNQNANKH